MSWISHVDSEESSPNSVLLFLGRFSTWIDHLLQEIEPHPRSAYVLYDGKVAEHVMMADVRGNRIAMLVYQPLVSCSICMSSSNIL